MQLPLLAVRHSEEACLLWTGARHHELGVLACNGLVPRWFAVSDRTPPVPTDGTPQPKSGLPLRARGLPRAGVAIPLPNFLSGEHTLRLLDSTLGEVHDFCQLENAKFSHKILTNNKTLR